MMPHLVAQDKNQFVLIEALQRGISKHDAFYAF
jgi:hypothetical protein